MKLQKRTAIVTGAGSGIGKAITLGLAKEGAQIVVNDINEERARSVSQEVRESYEVKCIPVIGDISEIETAYKLRDAALKEFRSIDILVNDAGILIPGSVFDYEEEDWDRIFAVNAKSVFLTCKVIGRVMVDQKYGRIINIASIAAKNGGGKFQVVYAATKAAVMNFTRAFSREVAPYNVNVNAICPGFIEGTEMTREALANPEVRKEYLERVPKGRLGTPEDLVGLTVFLCSNDSDFILGQAINVDGGVVYC